MSKPKNSHSFLSADRLAAIILVVVMFIYAYESLQFEKALDSDVIGPRFFPLLLALMGITLAIIQFLYSRTPATGGESSRSDSFEAGKLRNFFNRIDDLLPLIMLVIYVILMFSLGFILTTFLFGVVTLKLMHQPTWRGASVSSAALTLSVYVVFKILLAIPLPVGTIFEGFFGGTYGN
jgi:putative tricarboxylic transport membrane protein